MVDIFVGLTEKLFRVHKDLFGSKCDFFKKLFSNGFKETTDQTAKLSEVEPEVFDLFTQFIYRGELPSEPKIADEIWVELLKLHQWADFLCLPDVMDYTATIIL
jgi:hypothetical protein